MSKRLEACCDFTLGIAVAVAAGLLGFDHASLATWFVWTAAGLS